MQDKLEDKEIFGFQLNFPWKFRRGNLEDKSVCIGNGGNT